MTICFGYFAAECLAGYWCMNASVSSTPTDGVTGQSCPIGNFCPQGTPVPVACPTGTLSDSTGLSTAGDCQDCTGGYYCNGTGLTTPSGPCDPGYYCSRKAVTATPTDSGVTGDPCTTGHYCPGTTTSPLPCPDGTYMTNTGADACWNCTPGYYCTTGLAPDPCPPGFYCPEGTGVLWQSCPPGTYSTLTGLWHVDNCTQCTGGMYCATPNATSVTGACDPGYFCTTGSDTATPDVGNTGTAGPCPAGSYCTGTTVTPTGCPIGTYSNQTKLTASSQCTPCAYGHYCDSVGLTQPTGECWAGFFCLLGATSPNNPTTDATSGPCPVGHHCPNGTSYPLGCAAGTYNPSTGESSCTNCPAGYFCPENSTDYSSNVCPMGHYCPIGTGSMYEYPCDKGFYNGATGTQSVSDCVPCDPGKYCVSAGLSAPTADCAGGWYCVWGAWSDQPFDIAAYNESYSDCFCPNNKTGGQCQPGQFCPPGSVQPTPCTTGM